MAFEASYGLILTLSLVTIFVSICILIYAGHINSKGSDEQKRALPKLRKLLLWVSTILLILSLVAIIVSSWQYGNAKKASSLSALAARF